MIRGIEQSPFERHRSAILATAANLYAKEKEGADIAESDLHVMLPLDLGDMSEDAYRNALREQSQVDVAAKALARVALLRDDVERGRNPIKRIAARIDLATTRIADRGYIGGELGPDGLVEQIRGNITE